MTIKSLEDAFRIRNVAERTIKEAEKIIYEHAKKYVLSILHSDSKGDEYPGMTPEEITEQIKILYGIKFRADDDVRTVLLDLDEKSAEESFAEQEKIGMFKRVDGSYRICHRIPSLVIRHKSK